jgi:hypothetical protein
LQEKSSPSAKGNFIGKAVANQDSKAAAAWLSQLPNATAQSKVATGVTAAWAEQDPRAACGMEW